MVASENMSDEMPIHAKADSSWAQHLAKNSSLVTDLFGGQLISTIRCKVCGQEKVNFICFEWFSAGYGLMLFKAFFRALHGY